jgi:hypothetical protein
MNALFALPKVIVECMVVVRDVCAIGFLVAAKAVRYGFPDE